MFLKFKDCPNSKDANQTFYRFGAAVSNRFVCYLLQKAKEEDQLSSKL